MSEKITGYSLLSVGLVIMIFCVINIILVFTNQIKPFSYFNLDTGNNQTTSSSLNMNDLISKLQAGNTISADSLSLPKTDFLPAGSLDQILNLSTQFFLMTFILGFGYKLANLGVQLVRPINVKLKSAPEIPSPQPQQPPLQQV
jgi:hypothetical protein